MIPRNLHHAFEENRRVKTPGGRGRTRRRRLADLVLPTGRLALGLPDDGLGNRPGRIRPEVPPGVYPVHISIADHGRGRATAAFVTVSLTSEPAQSWEEAGEWFTDSGDGSPCDAAVLSILEARKREMPVDDWRALKGSALTDGDGNLLLDPGSGANAIVFRTCDWTYRCFLGRDGAGKASCIVVDGRADP